MWEATQTCPLAEVQLGNFPRRREGHGWLTQAERHVTKRVLPALSLNQILTVGIIHYFV